MKVPISPRPHQNLFLSVFTIIAILVGVKQYFTVILIIISLDLKMLSFFSYACWSFDWHLERQTKFSVHSEYYVLLGGSVMNSLEIWSAVGACHPTDRRESIIPNMLWFRLSVYVDKKA